MSKVIQYELNDDQLEKLKKIYENSKKNLRADIDTFDKFLNWTIEIAIESHIQFSTMNEKMMDIFNNNGFGQNSNFDLNNIDEFINNIFDTNVAKTSNKNKASSSKKEDDDKNKSSKIKN